MTESEWGPWIEHDGRGCHCHGKYVQSVKANGEVMENFAGMLTTDDLTGAEIDFDCGATNLWHWDQCLRDRKWGRRIIRYRIRKPKGLAILNAILREVERQPETV